MHDLDANEAVRAHFREALKLGGLADAEPDDGAIPTAARKRAFRDPRATSRLATISLIEDGDIVRWQYDPPPISSRRRRYRAASTSPSGTVIQSFPFLEVPPNEVIKTLAGLDGFLTKHQGMRRWDGKHLVFDAAPKATRRTLLLVHGTFSKSEMFFEELASNADGRHFLKNAMKDYKTILAFDHPTLSVSPWINALDLSAAMKNVTGDVDVICHSRGGLVVAWWLFLTGGNKGRRRVVFVGSPLGGTSLAAPSRLKSALDLLGNLSRAIGYAANAGATAVPMLYIAGGLMKTFGGLMSMMSSTPLIDAGMAVVPGLAAQSRVSNNYELRRLFAQEWMKTNELHAIGADYSPQDPEPMWKFWRTFSRLSQQALDSGSDIVFDGPNDLVVDYGSMRQLGETDLIPDSRILDLSASKRVHHCAYFRQKDAVAYLGKVFMGSA